MTAEAKVLERPVLVLNKLWSPLRVTTVQDAIGLVAKGHALIIDAKNDRAVKWYAGYGAVPLLDAPLTLVMALATLEVELKKAGRI